VLGDINTLPLDFPPDEIFAHVLMTDNENNNENRSARIDGLRVENWLRD
jgi:hypothetical protein